MLQNIFSSRFNLMMYKANDSINLLHMPKLRLDLHKTSLPYSATHLWNYFPHNIKTTMNPDSFNCNLF